MAGDWIKMRSNLWDDPRVARLCDLTDQPEAAVIGGLYWLWAVADQHSEDGVLPGLTLRQIDRKTGIPGLGSGLVEIGWLQAEDAGVRIVRFDEHNGASAKKRAQTARRVASHRSGNADVTPTALPTDDEGVTPALAREREEKELTTTTEARHTHHAPGLAPAGVCMGAREAPAAVGGFEGHAEPEAEAPVAGGGARASPEAQAAIALRNAGMRVTSQNPDLIAAIAEGVTVEALAELAEVYPGKSAGYVIAAARRQHAEGASPTRSDGAPHEAHRRRHRESAAERVERVNRELDEFEAAGAAGAAWGGASG